MLGLKRIARPLAMAASALIMLGWAVPAAQADPGEVRWQMLCSIDHFGPDDPIVFPGQPGESHMHSFYGNTTTNAGSTAASLMAAPSSCGRNMQTSDHSAYWIPSLYKKNADGSLALVKDPNQQMFIYYHRAGLTGGPKVRPFPPGLRMLAGNANATSPQSLSVMDWDCGGGGPAYPSIPQCPGTPSASLHATLQFPSCWDGTQLDSADHRSHMAYANASNGACPAGHPISLPQISYEIDYPGIAGGPQYTLSSHGPYSMHGDFFAAWDPQVQNALVAGCLNAGLDCIDVNRDGGDLVANNSTITIRLADYPATSQVLPEPATHAPVTHAPATHAPATHAPTKHAHAHGPTAAPTLAALPALATMPAAQSTPATTASSAFPATKAMGLAGGAVGLSLLAFAAYQLRRRLRGHDRRIRWP